MQFNLNKFDDDHLLNMWLKNSNMYQSPTNYHRWTLLSMVSSLLGRRTYIPFAGNVLYPNMYVLLVGNPASRKSTTMMRGRNMLEQLGYVHFAPVRASYRNFQNMFLPEVKEHRMKMVSRPGKNLGHEYGMKVLKANLNKGALKDIDTDKIKKSMDRDNARGILVLADMEAAIEKLKAREEEEDSELGVWASEFGEFMPSKSDAVIAALTDMYDTHIYDVYHMENIEAIMRPVINICGCITPSTLAFKFNFDSFEAGFLTRCILVHGSSAPGYVDPFDSTIDPVGDEQILNRLLAISKLKGVYKITPKARTLIKHISKSHPEMKDQRFYSYRGRRIAHIVKMAMTLSACREEMDMIVEDKDVLLANTILAYTELSMPDALGDFGSTPEIKVRNNILKFLKRAPTNSSTSAELLADVNSVSPLANLDSIFVACIAKMVREGILKEILSNTGPTVYSLNLDEGTDYEAINKLLIDKDLIEEWT